MLNVKFKKKSKLYTHSFINDLRSTWFESPKTFYYKI